MDQQQHDLVGFLMNQDNFRLLMEVGVPIIIGFLYRIGSHAAKIRDMIHGMDTRLVRVETKLSMRFKGKRAADDDDDSDEGS